MKKFTTLFVLLIFAFSIFTTNVGAFNIDTEFDTNDLTNQWEFVYEELSEIQEEPNVVNGFSMVDVNRRFLRRVYVDGSGELVRYNDEAEMWAILVFPADVESGVEDRIRSSIRNNFDVGVCLEKHKNDKKAA